MAQHRIADIGLGISHPSDYILDNNVPDKNRFDNVLEPVFKMMIDDIPIFNENKGFDFNINNDSRVIVGIEPSYKFEELFRISIHKDIEKSYIETGFSFGFYGTGIKSTIRYYSPRKSKYNNLIRKYHNLIYGKK